MIRFLEKTIPVTESGCWLWSGAVCTKGYGRFNLAGVNRIAHRVAWELFRGRIPDGLLVCHSCDVRCCVNPRHLWLGTAKDNVDDMISKGRDRKDPARGERNGSAKLTWEQVGEVRKDPRSCRVTGLAYGVSADVINMIRRNLTWKTKD